MESQDSERDALRSEVKWLRAAGQYDEAVAVAEMGLAIDEKILGPDHREVATSLENLAAHLRVTKK